jgi:hypothetical protein
MSWVDAVYDTVQDKDVRETRLDPGQRVHVDWAVVTNNGQQPIDVAIWVNPRQPHVKVWDPTGKNGASIEANFTGDDTHLERGSLSVDRLTSPA